MKVLCLLILLILSATAEIPDDIKEELQRILTNLKGLYSSTLGEIQFKNPVFIPDACNGTKMVDDTYNFL